jgi:hypothetical protein
MALGGRIFAIAVSLARMPSPKTNEELRAELAMLVRKVEQLRELVDLQQIEIERLRLAASNLLRRHSETDVPPSEPSD